MARFRTDVVTIAFRRNFITGRRFITAVRIVGRARPCNRFLIIGRRVLFAQNCLLANGFRLVAVRRNALVFERRRRID